MFQSYDHHQGAALFLAKITLLKTFTDWFLYNNLVLWQHVVLCRSCDARPTHANMTKWRMRIAYWIPKATNTHSEYATLIAFPMQQWLRERAWMLRYNNNNNINNNNNHVVKELQKTAILGTAYTLRKVLM